MSINRESGGGSETQTKKMREKAKKMAEMHRAGLERIHGPRMEAMKHNLWIYQQTHS